MHLLPADTSQGGVLPIPPLDVLQNSLEDPTSQVAPEVIMFSVLEGLQKLQTGFREHITEMDCLIKDTIECYIRILSLFRMFNKLFVK